MSTNSPPTQGEWQLKQAIIISRQMRGECPACGERDWTRKRCTFSDEVSQDSGENTVLNRDSGELTGPLLPLGACYSALVCQSCGFTTFFRSDPP